MVNVAVAEVGVLPEKWTIDGEKEAVVPAGKPDVLK